jgi:glycosyltransferase involved in cell wall biosynthesis
MKTKVAEALMFGKKVVGTPEAFAGYEEVIDRAGWVCATADEFANVIKYAANTITEPFDGNLRTLYNQKYSYSAARLRLKRILCNSVNSK